MSLFLVVVLSLAAGTRAALNASSVPVLPWWAAPPPPLVPRLPPYPVNPPLKPEAVLPQLLCAYRWPAQSQLTLTRPAAHRLRRLRVG